jgi:hypothetical protein
VAGSEDATRRRRRSSGVLGNDQGDRMNEIISPQNCANYIGVDVLTKGCSVGMEVATLIYMNVAAKTESESIVTCRVNAVSQLSQKERLTCQTDL